MNVQALGLETSDHELKEMLNDIDVDGDGTIEFEEFVRLLSGHLVRSHPLCCDGITMMCLSVRAP